MARIVSDSFPKITLVPPKCQIILPHGSILNSLNAASFQFSQLREERSWISFLSRGKSEFMSTNFLTCEKYNQTDGMHCFKRDGFGQIGKRGLGPEREGAGERGIGGQDLRWFWKRFAFFFK